MNSSTIRLPDSDQEIRLIDDAFGKVCSGVTDLSMHVRTYASKLLGMMTLVSSKFLNQTLDKKLMSNMRRKVIVKFAYSVMFILFNRVHSLNIIIKNIT